MAIYGNQGIRLAIENVGEKITQLEEKERKTIEEMNSKSKWTKWFIFFKKIESKWYFFRFIERKKIYYYARRDNYDQNPTEYRIESFWNKIIRYEYKYRLT